MRVVRVLPRAHTGAVTALVAIGKEQESLISGTEFTCFTGTKVPMFTSDEATSSSQVISGTEFTCFTSTKVPMFTSDEATSQDAELI